jgi:hypothetical protein
VRERTELLRDRGCTGASSISLSTLPGEGERDRMRAFELERDLITGLGDSALSREKSCIGPIGLRSSISFAICCLRRSRSELDNKETWDYTPPRPVVLDILQDLRVLLRIIELVVQEQTQLADLVNLILLDNFDA